MRNTAASLHRKKVCTYCVALLIFLSFLSTYLGAIGTDPKLFIVAGISAVNALISSLAVKFIWY